MSADPVVLIKALQQELESRGLTTFLDPLTVDPKTIGLRLAYAGFNPQGPDRERLTLTGALAARGVDPGRYLSLIMAHSRILSGLLESGLEYVVTPSTRKAKASISRIAEGRFSRDENSENLDWVFQEDFRVDISYNPAILSDPDFDE